MESMLCCILEGVKSAILRLIKEEFLTTNQTSATWKRVGKLKITTIHAPVGVALLRLKNEIVRLKNEIYFYFLIMSTSLITSTFALITSTFALITSTFALITSTYAKNRKKSALRADFTKHPKYGCGAEI
jgi:hypothetical protein